MTLTQRQRDVSERLANGMTIAAIAEDLGLTESRVNQIIRALKDRFEVDTQAGIVAAYQNALDEGSIEEDETAVGSESLVPDILNGPHPILYRFLAVSVATLVLVLAFLALTQLAIALSGASKSRTVVSLDREVSANG